MHYCIFQGGQQTKEESLEGWKVGFMGQACGEVRESCTSSRPTVHSLGNGVDGPVYLVVTSNH